MGKPRHGDIRKAVRGRQLQQPMLQRLQSLLSSGRTAGARHTRSRGNTQMVSTSVAPATSRTQSKVQKAAAATTLLAAQGLAAVAIGLPWYGQKQQWNGRAGRQATKNRAHQAHCSTPQACGSRHCNSAAHNKQLSGALQQPRQQQPNTRLGPPAPPSSPQPQMSSRLCRP